MAEHWTARDVPDQTGRVAVVTGANTGLGFETAQVLAERGASVVLAVRDVEKGKQAAARFGAGADVTVQELDLASLESVRTAAAELHTALPKIDLLINNAGVMYPPRQTTREGFELQFGTNHLGHFALTGLLLDLLLPVPGSRVVAVASIAHRLRAAIHFDDLQWENSYDRVAAYGQSKLANLLFGYELQRRLAPHGTTAALAAHPGVARTELMRNSPPRSAGSSPRSRPCSPRTRRGARCRSCAPPPTPAPSAASTTAPTDWAATAATRRSSPPAHSPTTWRFSGVCGRFRRSSRPSNTPSGDPYPVNSSRTRVFLPSRL